MCFAIVTSIMARKHHHERVIHDYVHEKLPHQEAIRILKLRPGSRGQKDIDCDLLTILPDDPPDKDGKIYEAVSWCWGSEKEDKDIRLHRNNKVYHHKIKDHLRRALDALRYPDEPRYLWIDAVCIDQSNIDEKNEQVPRMDTIYGGAQNVCIWLGPPSDTSTKAMSFIKDDVLKNIWRFDRICEDVNNTELFYALVELMKRPWFNRRWVVQEIALAKHGTVYCGTDHIDWHEFANAISLFVEVESASRRLSEIIKKDSEFGNLPGFFSNAPALGAAILVETTSHLFRTSPTGTRERLSSLENLVSRLPVFAASDPRDTVYALLAMAKDSNPQRTNVVPSQPLGPEPGLKPHGSTEGEALSGWRKVFRRFILHYFIQLLHPLTGLSRRATKHMKILRWREIQLQPPVPAKTQEEIRELLDRIKRRLRTPEQEEYEVNYTESVLEIYRQFIAFSIRKSEQSRALDIICRPWAPKVTNRDQWRYHKVERNGKLVSKLDLNSKKVLDQEVPLPSWIPSVKGAAYEMTDEYRKRPTDADASIAAFTQGMQRMNADPLVGAPDASFKNYSAAGTRSVNRKKLRFKKRTDHYAMFVEGFVLDTIQVCEEPAGQGNIPKEWLRTAGWDDVMNQEPPDAFWRTLIADRGPKGTNPPPFYNVSCREALRHKSNSETMNTSHLIEYGRCSIVAEFLRRVQATIWERKLLTTRKDGRLGLTNRKAKSGDQVCILYGCSVPVILRERRKTDAQMVADEEDDKKELTRRVIKAAQLIKQNRERHMKSGTRLRRRKRPLWRRVYDARNYLRLLFLVLIAAYIFLQYQDPRGASIFVVATLIPLLSLLPNELSDVSGPIHKVLTRIMGKLFNNIVAQAAIVTILACGVLFVTWPKIPFDTLWITSGCLLIYPQLLPRNIHSMILELWGMFGGAKKKEEHVETFTSYYEFIGEAYVHGMMNGEAIAWQNEHQVKAQTFELH